jgi:hypothetical protein
MYYERELCRKAGRIGIYVAIPTVIFLVSALRESTVGVLVAIFLFLPVLSTHFRNLLWSRTVQAVYCRTCGRQLPAALMISCESCGFRSLRNIFSPCPNCFHYQNFAQCPTCEGHLLIAREEAGE